MTHEENMRELKKLWQDGYTVCSIIKAREILKNSPNEFSVLAILSESLAAINQFENALKTIETAVKVATHEQLYQALVTKAFILEQAGNYKEAEQWYEKAFSLRPARPIDLVVFCECLIKRGQNTRAIDLLTKFISDSMQGKDSIFYMLGFAYRGIEQYDEALKYFQKTIEINSEHELAIEAKNDILKMRSYQILH